MKYALVIFIYSLIGTPQLLHQEIRPIEYPTYYDCISDGYISSYNSLMKIGVEQVNRQVLAVKFECKEVNTS